MSDATRLGRAVHARAHRRAQEGLPATAVAGGVAAAAAAFAAGVSAAPGLPRAARSGAAHGRPGSIAGPLYPRDVAVHRPREVVAAGPMLRAHERSARGTA